MLCAVDPRASPRMGVRIGRYRQSWDGSGMTVGDTNVQLDPSDPQGVRSMNKVGTVTIRDEGKEVLAPVYLAAVPLQSGELADYLQWQGSGKGGDDAGDRLDWFNIEFGRTLETRLTDNNGIFDRKPLGPRSGVHSAERVPGESADRDCREVRGTRLQFLQEQESTAAGGDAEPVGRGDEGCPGGPGERRGWQTTGASPDILGHAGRGHE